MQRIRNCVWIVLIGWGVLAPQPAAADFISLDTALSGVSTPGQTVELTVSFDPASSVFTNLVSHELYVEFDGLTPLTYALGSVYALAADLMDWDGLCSETLLCSYPVGDEESASHYQSYALIFPDDVGAVPGTLFTLRFTATGPTWSLNVFGDDQDGLNWFDENDPNTPYVSYVFVSDPNSIAPPGFARVLVSATVSGGDVEVPEPSLVLLAAAGVASAVWRRRRR